MDLNALLLEEKEKQKAKQAELDRQLQTALQNRTTLIDTTPIAGFVDSMYNSGSSAGAKAVAQASKEQDDVLNGLLKDLRDYKNQGIDPAKIMLQQQARSAAEAGKEGRQEDAQLQAAYKDVVGVFGKERQASDEYDRQIGGIEDAIKDGSYERIKGQLSNFARAVNAEKGVLTDQDLGRTFIDTIDSTIARYAAKLDKSGKLNPADLVNLSNAINDSKARFYGARNKRIQDRKATYQGNPTYAKAVQQIESVPGQGITASMKDVPMPAKAPPSAKVQAILDSLKKKGS